MKKYFTSVLMLISVAACAGEMKWSASLDQQKVFIENKANFKNVKGLPDAQILFATEDGATQILFTKTGLTFKLERREHPEIDEREARKEGLSHEELERKEREMKVTTDVIHMQWKNSNPGVEVIPMDEVHAGYFYKTQSGSIKARAFSKIIYRNIYPNIDVEYVFHPQTGIEYSFFLHPGANPNDIQMSYSDVSGIFIDKNQNLHLPTIFGDILDHQPKTFYADNKTEIDSWFMKKGKTISFGLNNYDASREVIIDPWTVTPAMGNSNKVFNIESDSSGNAYIYGGDSPYKLQKYDPSGNLQWTFTNGWDSASYWCGTLIVDRAGNSYITAGSSAEITKVNTSGSQVWTNSGGIFDEYWTMAFNCDESELIVGGTRLTGLPIITGSGRAYNINLSNGNVINSIKVSNAIPSFIFNDPNEIRSVCASPNGNYYFLTLDTLGALAPALAAINWETQSGYRFGYGSPNYGFTPQGQSIIRATASHIYTANGDSVVKRDISTGAIVAAAAIPGGGHATTFLVPGTLPKNGGLVIDSCGNVFAGSQNNVTMYDANLNFISSTTTPSAVYDVAIGINGDVLACGSGFAVALAISSCAQIHLSCNTTILPAAAFSAPNAICPGTCTNYTNLSSNATSYQWYFPGGQPSVSTDTDPFNICYNTPGSYDVTLVASSASGVDSVTVSNYITVYAYPPAQGIVQIGDTIFANQGSASYQWYKDDILIPGATDYFYALTEGGNYGVVCTDINGCEVEAVIFDVTAGIFDRETSGGALLNISPNPVLQNLDIRFSGFEKKEIEIKIYNMLGEEIYSSGKILNSGLNNKFKIDCSAFPAGTYSVELSSEKNTLKSKFVKSNSK